MRRSKRLLAVILLTALLTVLFSGFAQAATYLYVKKSVHMRTGAGVSYKSITILSTGTKVTKLGSGHASNGDLWYKVKYNGRTGWINAGYLSSRKPGVVYIKATKGSTKIRTDASLDASAIGTLPKGMTAVYQGSTKTDERGVDWYKIKYNGKTGWVSSKYTKKC